MKHAMLRVVTAAGLGLAMGWVLAAQEPKKEWKNGQEEYNLFQAYQKADAKGKVEALDKWKAAFPTSDFAEEREEQFLIVYQQVGMNRQAFDKAAEILKTRPNHFYSLSAIERLVFALTPAPTPADLDTAERVSKYILENLDTAFAASNRPADVKEADWTTYKPAMQNAAQATLARIFVQRKDHPKAEIELTKYLHMDPTQGATSLSLGSELLAQNKEHPEKLPLGLYHFARAAAYDGQNSLPAASRKSALDYLTKTYTAYHDVTTGNNLYYSATTGYDARAVIPEPLRSEPGETQWRKKQRNENTQRAPARTSRARCTATKKAPRRAVAAAKAAR